MIPWKYLMGNFILGHPVPNHQVFSRLVGWLHVRPQFISFFFSESMSEIMKIPKIWASYLKQFSPGDRADLLLRNDQKVWSVFLTLWTPWNTKTNFLQVTSCAILKNWRCSHISGRVFRQATGIYIFGCKMLIYGPI